MLTWPRSVRVFVYTGPTDIECLAAHSAINISWHSGVLQIDYGNSYSFAPFIFSGVVYLRLSEVFQARETKATPQGLPRCSKETLRMLIAAKVSFIDTINEPPIRLYVEVVNH